MVADKSLGPRWMDLVGLWVSFEHQQGYVAAAPNLSATGRPEAVGDWIQRARNAKWRPNITNIKEYTKAHTTWWKSVQPDWRIDEDGEICPTAEGDWSSLRKPGVNGLLSAVASLYFWGVGRASRKRLGPWDSSVEDVIFVLTHLQQN